MSPGLENLCPHNDGLNEPDNCAVLPANIPFLAIPEHCDCHSVLTEEFHRYPRSSQYAHSEVLVILGIGAIEVDAAYSLSDLRLVGHGSPPSAHHPTYC